MAGARNKRNARSKARTGNWSGWRRESERNSKPNMLSQAQRTAILELSAKRVSKREIARVLQLSRLTVRKVLRSNSTQVPEIQRAQKAEPYRQQILDLWIACQGNLVRVHEELTASGARLSYPALTAFCRRQGIGQTPVVPAGQYHFEPGVEMQHDTSPHAVEVGGRKYQAQTASAVLCYSRLLFFQINPRFQRFDCKVFLTDALRYMGGTVKRVMIDNTHVVVLRGTGREMIPVPEMEAFAERFGFHFVAHERGDANRSARVERPFAFIENNFLAGRRFASWDDLNQQARQWCDRVNSTYKKHIRAVPRELFAVERLHLKPLPAWIPEVYRLHPRTVDVEGYVSVNSIRYSVPVAWIGRRVEVRETRDKLEIELDARHIVTHGRALTPPSQRITLAEHRPPRGEGIKRSDPHPEEQAIVQAAPEIAPYVAALKQKGRKVVALALRQLLRLLKEYPRPPFLAAVREAAQYGLYDLDRLERMILRRVAQDYFLSAFAMARPAGKCAGVAHPPSQSAGALVAGIVSLVAPARSEPQADARFRRTRLCRPTREPGVGGPNRRRQNRSRQRPPVEGSTEWSPLSVHSCSGSVRRNVRIAGRPLHPPVAESPGSLGCPID